jgi:hypothetical protein
VVITVWNNGIDGGIGLNSLSFEEGGLEMIGFEGKL